MKTKHLFLSALTCLAFAACSNDDDAVQNPQSENERAYIAVNFSMPGSGATTRWGASDGATEENYVAASTAELAVEKIAFFFFNSEGSAAAEPCFINADANLWQGTNDNHAGGNGTDDKSTNVILTVKNPKDVAQVVAILNPTTTISGWANTVYVKPYEPGATISSAVTLNALTEELLVASGGTLTTPTITNPGASETISEKLLMSNSVYQTSDGSSVIKATPITTNNLYTTVNAAEQNPITIHVERIWARVKVDVNVETVYDAKDKTDNVLSTTDSENLKIRLKGWWLNNTNQNAYVLKNLTPESLSPWWNDYADYRSYWANSYAPDGDLTSSFLGHANYNAYSVVDKYCLENTLAAQSKGQYSITTTIGSESEIKTYTSATQIVVAAEIGIMDGGNFQPTEIIEYMGKYYTTADFKTYLLSTDEFKKITKNNVALTEGDIKLVHNTEGGAKILYDDYNAIVQLEDGTYKYDGTDTEVATINATLKDIFGERKYWKNGKSYYFAKISHNTESDAKYNYAIIRNHLYNVTISGVVGLGTPVTDPEIPIIPEYPDESTESYLACKIAVLKYRVVGQDVTLGGENQQ